MEKKKVILVTPSVDGGGAEKILIFVAKKLKLNGFLVEILTFKQFHSSSIEGINLTVISPKIKGKILGKFSMSYLIRQHVKTSNCDGVIAFGVLYSLICKMALVHLPVKLIVSERRSPMNLNYFWKKISQLVYKSCDGVVYQLYEVEKYYGFKNTRSIVIHNPYISPAKLVSKGKNKSDANIIVSGAARLDEYEKGMDILIDSFMKLREKFPDLRLHLYGEILNDNFISKKLRSQSERIEIFPKSQNIIDHINASTIFVLPSRLEGIPNILLEALGEGNATVSADCPPGGPRLLTDGGAIGELFLVGDSNDLFEKIKNLLDNHEKIQYFEEKSIEVRKRFNEEKIGNQWVKFINSILEEEF